MEGVHHAVQQVMNVLTLRELDVAHARVAQRQSETIKTPAIPVSEVTPVHLALFARAGLKADKGAFATFLPPWRHRQLQLGVTSRISSAAGLFQQLASVMHSLFPAFPKEAAVGIDFSGHGI